MNLIPEPRNEICGNYKKEKDEECDPGGIVPQDSMCCTKECKLKPKSLCRYVVCPRVRTNSTAMKGEKGKVSVSMSLISVNHCNWHGVLPPSQ